MEQTNENSFVINVTRLVFNIFPVGNYNIGSKNNPIKK